jgi:glyoxylase-like metal-dependent hydrolase (beta-lactamase superfamily II)
MRVEGMPAVQEHVFYHGSTRTLIIADLMFNIAVSGGWLTRALLKIADIGGRPRPSRLWRTMIKDSSEFGLCIQQIRKLDFDRIVPGHGEVVESNAKEIFDEAFSRWL